MQPEEMNERDVPRLVHTLDDGREIVLRVLHLLHHAGRDSVQRVGDDLLGEGLLAQLVAVLEDADVVAVRLEELQVLARLRAEAVHLRLGVLLGRDDGGLVRLQPSFANADLARIVRQLGEMMVVDARSAERLKGTRRPAHDMRVVDGVPEVELSALRSHVQIILP